MASGRLSAKHEAAVIKLTMMVKATIADNERIPAPRQLAGLRNAALLATPNIILVHHSAEAR